MNIDNAYELEWDKTLQSIADKNKSLHELEYFLNIARTYVENCSKQQRKPRAILIGNSFPEEIIRAMGIDYCYANGGSFENTLADNVNLPKDADDTTRSIVGALKNNLNLQKDDVVLVPLCNDSMKKLHSRIGNLATVICYEVPSDKEDQLQIRRFAGEVDRVTSELKKHFKRKLSAKSLKGQCYISRKAAKAFIELESLYKKGVICLSASAFVFVANSYHLCTDKQQWALHLELLVKELSDKGDLDVNKYPEIMLFGSPIYVPDYKVLFVIEEMKLRLATLVHPDILHIKIADIVEDKAVSVKYLAKIYLESDISPAFINNSTMTELVINALKEGNIKGVIAHILKGQIEYDYELKSIDKLVAEYKIPLNRIETVYNYQDIEQLRLRLEAFSEMLNM